MEFGFYSITVKLTFLYFLFKFVTFTRFYLNARRTGFPVYISPILSKSIPWMVLGPAFQPQLERYLPAWIYDRMDPVIHAWEFRKKSAITDRLGRVFVVVSPDECSLWVADPALGQTILQRRKDFVQAPIAAKIVGLLGPNLLGADGENWQRQRKLVASNLNERISEITWSESCQQAQSMIEYLVDHPGGQTLESLRCIAINVIGRAGFGQNQPWSPYVQGVTTDSKGGRAAYFGALSLLTSKILEAALISPKVLKLSFMPLTLRVLGREMERIPQYVKDMLQEERKIVEKASAPRSNFLSMLVQLSDKEKTLGPYGASLTEAEISGNIFLFGTAGFDTTANTMGYAVILLAAYPEWQDWIREELHDLGPDLTTGKYEEVFPKCQRLLALMFETMRHFPPVVHSTRAFFEPQQVVDSNGSHLLSPPMDVYVSHQCIHADTSIWGPDASEFKPSRWIDSSGQLITPTKGTFLPWSGGPRICPGMKMSQVEFVATLATLFRSARCEPLPTDRQEKPEELRKKLHGLMKNSICKLTLQVREPKEVKLRWIPDA